MSRLTLSFTAGVAAILVWYFVALEFVWQRSGISVALGVSLALNAAMAVWIFASDDREPRTATPSGV